MSCTSFILNRKEWGLGKLERERESKRIERETECGIERVAAWVIILTVSYYDGNREMDNPRLYQVGNRNYPTDLDGQYFLYERYNCSSI